MSNRDDDYPGQDRDHGEDPGKTPIFTPVPPNPTPTPKPPFSGGPPPLPTPSEPPYPGVYTWVPPPPESIPPPTTVGDTPDTGDNDEPPAQDAEPIVPTPVEQSGIHRTDVFVAPDAPLPIIYGKVNNVGGQIWYEKRETSSGGLILLYLICHGEVNSITNLRFEDQPFSTFGLVAGTHYNVYTGTAGQGLDPIGSAWEPNWTSHFPNVAYIAVRIPSSVLSGIAVPDWHRFLCDVEGMKVRDHRTDPTLATRYYRNNPALCIADFMTSPARTADDGQKYVYGAGLSDSQLDWSTVDTAANDCDTLMADAVTKRYTLGWVINDRRDWTLHVAAMRLQAALLAPQYNNGLYQFAMDKAQGASGYVLTDAGPNAQIVAASPWRVKGSAEVPTRVNANFWDVDSSYKDSPVYDEDAGIAGGTVELVTASTDYRFGAMPYDQAKRLCRYMRKRLALDKTATLYLLMDTAIELLPGMRVKVTSAQLGVSNLDVIVTGLKTSTDPRWNWEMTFELYDAAVYDDTQASTTSFPIVASTLPYDMPPEVTGLTVTTGGTSASPTFALYWSGPQIRSTTMYGAASWSATNPHNYTAANVNNGVTNVTAFDWNVAGDCYVDLDLGSAKAIREFEISRSTVSWGQNIYYSDDAISWTKDTTARTKKTVTSGGIQTDYVALGLNGAGVGSHRYWRIRKDDAGAQTDVYTEIQPREYSSDYTFVKEYRVYNLTDRSAFFTFLTDRQPIETLPVSLRPTSTNPLDVTPYGGFTYTAPTATISLSAAKWWKFAVTVVSGTGTESAGYIASDGTSTSGSSLGGSSTSVIQSGAALTLANGLNSNIACAAGPPLQRITGPTGAFTLGGFTVGAATPVDGDVLRLYYNSTQVCTIKNEDASSTAANRIKTLTGADMAVTGPFEIWFSYNVDANRWIVVSLSPAAPLYERGRADAAGAGIAFTPSRTASAGTWTNGTVITSRYSIVGKTMTVWFEVDASTVSNAGVQLQVTIPGGYTSANQIFAPYTYNDNLTGWAMGQWRVNAGGTTIIFYTAGTGNFAASTLQTYVSGVFTFEVQ